MSDEVIDLSACVPCPKIIKVGGKEYKMSFPYRAVVSLEKQYGTVKDALEDLLGRDGDVYSSTLNFLYAALGEKYNLKKSDIEEWITVTTIRVLHDAIYEALLGSFGRSTDAGERSPGEM